jgi:hypothetical protein
MTSPTWGRISRGFSWYHTALDIVNTYRTPIKAPEAGVVTWVGQMGSGLSNAGNVVQIGNPAGNAHRLCHLDSYIVKSGQSVSEGQVVGYMGYTGFTNPTGIGGTHLHWIMFRAGKRVNPLNYVSVPTGSAPIPAKMPAVGQVVKFTVPRTAFVAGTTTVVFLRVQGTGDLTVASVKAAAEGVTGGNATTFTVTIEAIFAPAK